MIRRFALLATLNARYVEVLRVLVASLERSNPNAVFDLYILHKSLSHVHFERLATASLENKTVFHPIVVSDARVRACPDVETLSFGNLLSTLRRGALAGALGPRLISRSRHRRAAFNR
ncbi:MAG: hypothetical protein MZU97_17375 [Bacillus subtilis]|nr:hypothetical protein [Bacillus subtilis]